MKFPVEITKEEATILVSALVVLQSMYGEVDPRKQDLIDRLIPFTTVSE